MRSIGMSESEIQQVLQHTKAKAIDRLGEKRGQALVKHMK